MDGNTTISGDEDNGSGGDETYVDHLSLYLMATIILLVVAAGLVILTILCMRRWKKRKRRSFETMESAGDEMVSEIAVRVDDGTTAYFEDITEGADESD